MRKNPTLFGILITVVVNIHHAIKLITHVYHTVIKQLIKLYKLINIITLR